jgi:hypothetical protein
MLDALIEEQRNRNAALRALLLRLSEHARIASEELAAPTSPVTHRCDRVLRDVAALPEAIALYRAAGAAVDRATIGGA